MQKKRYFTVEEANACIPDLNIDITELLELKDQLEELHAELTPFLTSSEKLSDELNVSVAILKDLTPH